jgi:hypothetical protein
MKKGLNSLIILGSWLLWKLRNSIVFDGACPCLNTLLAATQDEFQLWCMAGAKDLRVFGQAIGGT